MPAQKVDYNEELKRIELKHDVKFTYDGYLNSHTSLSCDCIEKGCNKICSRQCRDLLKDDYCMCTSHLKRHNLIEKHGTQKEVMEKIDNAVIDNTVEILTEKGLTHVGLFKATIYYKIPIKMLQKKYNYLQFIQEKNKIATKLRNETEHPELKNKMENYVKQYGAKVLCLEWIKENTDKIFYRKIKNVGIANKTLLLKPLAKEFGVYDEWNNLYKTKVHGDKSKWWAKIKQERKIDAKNTFRGLYDKEGITVFDTEWLDINHSSLYKTFHFCGIRFGDLSKEFGCHKEYIIYRQNRITESCGKCVRTIENFYKEADEIYEKYKCFPTAAILRQNGYGGFASDLYTKNYTTLEELNKKYDVPLNALITAKNGFVMDSQCETHMVNFLYTRGIVMTKGRQYANSYCKTTGKKGIYDLHFISLTDGCPEISVEIWGGCFLPGKQDVYNKKRKDKEESHSGDNTFLGIEHEDCFSETKLIQILEPYIGVIKPYVFPDEIYKTISCTKWNLTDGITKGCTYIMEHNDSIIPSTGWMRCKNKYKYRIRGDWEINDNFNINHFASAIDRFGGIIEARKMMNVSFVTRRYDECTTISKITQFIKKIYETYTRFPRDISNQFQCNKKAIKAGKSIIALSDEDDLLYKKCVTLMYMIDNKDNKQLVNKTSYDEICNKIKI